MAGEAASTARMPEAKLALLQIGEGEEDSYFFYDKYNQNGPVEGAKAILEVKFKGE